MEDRRREEGDGEREFAEESRRQYHFSMFLTRKYFIPWCYHVIILTDSTLGWPIGLRDSQMKSEPASRLRRWADLAGDLKKAKFGVTPWNVPPMAKSESDLNKRRREEKEKMC